MADHPTVDHHLGTAARMPRQVLGRPQFDVHPGRAGDHPHGVECISCLDRPTRTPGPAGFAQPGQHHADMHRLMGQSLVQQSDLGVGGSAVGGDQADGAGLRARLHHLGNREQCDVSESAGHVAHQRFHECRQQRRGQVRTVRLQRIEHRRRVAAWVVGGQTPLVEHPGGQERRGQHLHVAGQRQRLTDRATALLPRGQATAGGCGGQHRGNGVEALQPQHLLDEVRRRGDIRSPTRRGDGQHCRTRLRGHPCTDLGQSAHRRAIRIDHPGHPIRKVDGHLYRRRREVLARRIPAPVGERGPHCATGNLGQQSRSAIDGGHRDGRVDPAFVATAGLADQMQSAHRARYRGRIPDRGFQEDIGGVVIDLGGSGAHHAADRCDGHIIDDQHVAGFQCAVDAVQGDHPLTRFGEPDRKTPVDLAAVVCVHGVPEFEHHVVGDIHRRRDRPNTREHQPATQPPRRQRFRVDPGHRAQGKAADARSGLDRHR